VRPTERSIATASPLVLKEGQFDDRMRATPEIARGLMTPYAGEVAVW
jgi:hypothetical protein